MILKGAPKLKHNKRSGGGARTTLNTDAGGGGTEQKPCCSFMSQSGLDPILLQPWTVLFWASTVDANDTRSLTAKWNLQVQRQYTPFSTRGR